MINIRVDFCYKGSYFCGSQKQKAGLTVQGIFEQTLSRLCGEKIKFVPCSRLDSGVNALKMVGNFKVSSSKVKLENLRYVLNRLFPPFIRVLNVEQVAEDFNSRFDAIRKTYRYDISLRKDISPFDQETTYYPIFSLDVEKFKSGSRLFEGEHDFAFFATPEKGVDTRLQLSRVAVTIDGDRLYIRLAARRFLRYQVRFIVGSLILLAQDRLKLCDLEKRLGGVRDKGPNYKAPAEALFLEDVEFDLGRVKSV